MASADRRSASPRDVVPARAPYEPEAAASRPSAGCLDRV